MRFCSRGLYQCEILGLFFWKLFFKNFFGGYQAHQANTQSMPHFPNYNYSVRTVITIFIFFFFQSFLVLTLYISCSAFLFSYVKSKLKPPALVTEKRLRLRIGIRGLCTEITLLRSAKAAGPGATVYHTIITYL